MRIHQGIAALAVFGIVALTSGVAQAGGGCCGGKATQTSSGTCGAKGSAVQTGGGCGSSMKASGGSCTGSSATMCQSMSAADCEKMLRTYYQTHGWLGTGPDCCAGMQVRPAVTRITAGSPAEKAGFKTGDVLTSINGINYGQESQAAMQSLMMKGMKVGDTVRYTVLRDGQVVALNATLVKIPDSELNVLVAEHTAMPHRAADKAENVR
jgi:hypothetical protein